MAGDWIKMRADLHTHPKIVRMASALKADRLRIVGGLHSAWCLFDVHSVDGFLDGYSPETLDDMIGFPGFSRAMMSVGWLEIVGDNLVMPGFSEHNGQSAKRRAQDAERKRNVRNMSALQPDKTRTREEKRREELKDNPPKPPGGRESKKFDPLRIELPDWLPAELWTEWVAFREELKKPIKTMAGITGTLNKLEKFRVAGHKPADVIAQSIANEWQGLFEVSDQHAAFVNIDFFGSFDRLVLKGKEPRNEAERKALRQAQAAGLRRRNEVQAQSAWRGYLKQAYGETGEKPEGG